MIMKIDEDIIRQARAIIDEATKAPTYYTGLFRSNVPDEQVAQFRETIAKHPAGPVHAVCVAVNDHTPVEDEALFVAITGNGPTSHANARYIKHSFDPVGGWRAAIDEVERLRDVIRRAAKVVDDTDQDFAERYDVVRTLRAAIGEDAEGGPGRGA